jgi:hypothetical protein
MKTQEIFRTPRRITDLIEHKGSGRTVTCLPSFEILPVDFLHRKNPYKAYIFLCRFNGEIDEETYSFRKCYARGCPENQCSHVSRAIMIANRYLQRDYSRLEKAGIKVDHRLFSLEDMLVKYDGYQQEHDTSLALEDCIQMSEGGTKVGLSVDLEYVPAVEHFSNYENSQTFLTADFIVTAGDQRYTFQRCLSCYQTDKEKEEKGMQMEVANARLKLLYQEFARNSVKYTEMFFS